MEACRGIDPNRRPSRVWRQGKGRFHAFFRGVRRSQILSPVRLAVRSHDLYFGMRQTLTEDRVGPRTTSFERAVILLPYSGIAVDCVVRNLSRSGACLVIEDANNIPDDFDLTMGNSLRPCRVVWRESFRLGVEFQEHL